MAAALRYWVEHRGRIVELPAGVTLLGRGEQCQIVLDDGLVSRQHARIVVDQAVRIEDAGSSNGLQVNGVKTEGVELSDGDVITIGQQRLVFHSAEMKGRRRAHTMAETLHGVDPFVLDGPAAAAPAPARDPLELLGAVIDKALAMGRGNEAERMLAPHLERVAEAVRNGEDASSITEQAAGYAVRLAEATKKADWVDYSFELYSALRAPLPEAVVEQLYTTVRTIPGVSRPIYRDYVKVLEGVASGFGPRQRFLVQRINGLESVFR